MFVRCCGEKQTPGWQNKYLHLFFWGPASCYYQLCLQQGVRASQFHRQAQFHMNMQSVGTSKLPKAQAELLQHSPCHRPFCADLNLLILNVHMIYHFTSDYQIMSAIYCIMAEIVWWLCFINLKINPLKRHCYFHKLAYLSSHLTIDLSQYQITKTNYHIRFWQHC